MQTPWADTLDRAQPLPEYPRPQMVRDSYLNLNGPWSYAITTSANKPAQADGTILVPFSPESELSGVGHVLQPEEYLWYIRTVTLPDGFNVGRVLLHFGAVDQTATVWCNGVELATHTGGYLPFTVDITEVLAKENTILVCVRDATNKSQLPRGKQTLHPHGIWYTPQSGIWQTVWAEHVPENYVQALLFTPELPEGRVRWRLAAPAPKGARIEISYQGTPVGSSETDEDGCGSAVLPPEQLNLWSPEAPNLYDVTITLGDDTVRSYFAMRTVDTGKDAAGHPCLLLNGQPYFHHGVLDQGYWPDGLYTAPSDDALVYDIQLAKDMGFNMLRKHIKVECDRWYYHCDRLGMLVWQDMPCGGRRYDPLIVSTPLVTGWHLDDSWYPLFGRTNVTARKAFLNELRDMVTTLYNHPCIAMWVPFNEGWGQFDAARMAEKVRALDPTRLIDHASGWHDQGAGDLRSYHVYYKPVRMKHDGRRALALTEFGGYSLPLAGHYTTEKSFGYRVYRDAGRWMDAVEKLYKNEVIPLIVAQGLSAAVYTQVSDVEDEVNGLLTFDRRVCKPDAARMRRINEKLRF